MGIEFAQVMALILILDFFFNNYCFSIAYEKVLKIYLKKTSFAL